MRPGTAAPDGDWDFAVYYRGTGFDPVLAARGEWVNNEKTLIDRAGLRGVHGILAGLTAEPARLCDAVERATALLR